MSNKPSAKAIARLNATTLFPEIKKEIEKNPSLFAIRGFFIFNVTKKGVPMTEWYLLFQGFDAPAVVSQVKPEIPKTKKDEQPIPVAIIQIEDSDLMNFMSGGLTGSRGIVSGKIKIAGAMELAEQLEEIFRKAKGAEKTLAYLEHKRGKSSNPPPPTGKVQGMARKYSLMAKQAAEEGNYVPRNNIQKQPIVTGAVKPKVAVATAAAATAAIAAAEPAQEKILEQSEDNQEALASPVDIEQEIESTLQVADLTNKIEEVEIAAEEEEKAEEPAPIVAEPIAEEPINNEEAKQEQEAVIAEVVKAAEIAEIEAPAVVEEVNKAVEEEINTVAAAEEEEKTTVVAEAATQDTQSIEEEEEIKNAPIEA
ncbi:hypothetical protein FBU30_005251 [Linnemannia zychae]|nr:hypothetical protein FBU30_005251 [Linnemannia zychae]